ncbi:MAG: 50S ribosomal protein L20 [Candidatus Campbellbacteria bacterium]|nr:50S ribosomal protein L20 [Candidatus Campbellbacteria bacterium]
MPRIKRGTTSLKRRKSTLKKVKGFRFGISNKERQANEAIRHAGLHAYRDRRVKKGTFRRLWNIRLNAALRSKNTTYSKFIDTLNKRKININRKMLSSIAQEHPETFDRIVTQVESK